MKFGSTGGGGHWLDIDPMSTPRARGYLLSGDRVVYPGVSTQAGKLLVWPGVSADPVPCYSMFEY